MQHKQHKQLAENGRMTRNGFLKHDEKERAKKKNPRVRKNKWKDGRGKRQLQVRKDSHGEIAVHRECEPGNAAAIDRTSESQKTL
jgi:hypothetical protein